MKNTYDKILGRTQKLEKVIKKRENGTTQQNISVKTPHDTTPLHTHPPL